MEILRVHFCDYWPNWEVEDFITPILKKHFVVVLDKHNPNVLFHSIFNKLENTKKYKCKKVLYLGENWRPSQFGSNYSISFDPHSETNFRLPLWQVYLLLNPELKNRLYERRRLETFEKFCSFTVSNPSNFIRNGFYQQLNNYKRVHSYGRYMTNDFNLLNFSEGKFWRDAKDEFFLKHTHKYSIAFENTFYPGYTTEKLMDSFIVGSMPIYNGSPKVHEEFNEKAFINVKKVNEALELVKNTDLNKDIFNKYYNEPIFLPHQIEELETNLINFEKWLLRIVDI